MSAEMTSPGFVSFGSMPYDDVYLEDDSSEDEDEHVTSDSRKPLMSPRKRPKVALRQPQTSVSVYPIIKKRFLKWFYVIVTFLFISLMVFVLMRIAHDAMQEMDGSDNSNSVPDTSFNKNKNPSINVEHTSTEKNLIPCSDFEVQDVWVQNIPKLITETAFRLVDVNKDGVLDIIMGFTTGVTSYFGDQYLICDIYFNGTRPCFGGLMALDGVSGNELWRHYTQNEVFAVNCNVDVDRDGVKDCLGGGRAGTFLLISGATGQEIWTFQNKELLVSISNFYTAQFIHDVDGDGIEDVLNIHGGDPLRKPGEETTHTGILVVISGATGHVITSMQVPDGRESYYSPQVYYQHGGREMVLFGTGGETRGGSLWVIPMTDLLQGDASKVTKIYTDKYKGVMTPPVLVDITGDGVVDIVMAMFNSTIVAFDGQNYKQLWNYTMEESETYSTPAVAYYNNDDIPDFMISYNHGPGYPVYYYSQVTILDGRTGKPLLSPAMRMAGASQSSPLTLSMEGHGNDLYIYFTLDCLGHEGESTEFAFSKDKRNFGIGIQSRSDFCMQRFNTKGFSRLSLLSQHMQPPGQQIYNSMDRVNVEYQYKVNSSLLAKAYLANHPQVLETVKKFLLDSPHSHDEGGHDETRSMHLQDRGDQGDGGSIHSDTRDEHEGMGFDDVWTDHFKDEDSDDKHGPLSNHQDEQTNGFAPRLGFDDEDEIPFFNPPAEDSKPVDNHRQPDPFPQEFDLHDTFPPKYDPQNSSPQKQNPQDTNPEDFHPQNPYPQDSHQPPHLHDSNPLDTPDPVDEVDSDHRISKQLINQLIDQLLQDTQLGQLIDQQLDDPDGYSNSKSNTYPDSPRGGQFDLNNPTWYDTPRKKSYLNELFDTQGDTDTRNPSDTRADSGRQGQRYSGEPYNRYDDTDADPTNRWFGRVLGSSQDGFSDRDDIVGRHFRKRREVADVETQREILSDANLPDSSKHARKVGDDFTVIDIPGSFISDPAAVRKLDDPENVDKSKTQDSSKEKLLPVEYINNELFLKLENRGPLASELIRKWLREQAGSERLKRETGRSSEEKRDGFLDRDDIVGRNLKKRTEVAGVETLELQETLEKLREILSDSNFLDNSEHTRSKLSDDFVTFIPVSFVSDPEAVRKLDDPENVDKSKTQDSSKEKLLPVGYINNELFLKLENRGPLASELIRKWLQEQAGSERCKRETGRSSEEKRDGFLDRDDIVGRNLKKRTEVARVETLELQETLEKLREILSDSNFLDNSEHTRSKLSDDFVTFIPVSFVSDPEAVRKLGDPKYLNKSKTQDSNKEKHLPVEYINNELFLKLENRGPLASELIRKWLREQTGSERFKRETGGSSEEKRDGFSDGDNTMGRNLKKRTEVAGVETQESRETLEKLREILSDSNLPDSSQDTRKVSDDFTVIDIPGSFTSDPEAVRKLDDPENLDKSKTQDSSKEKLLPVEYINNELFLKLENRGPLASELIRKWLREQAGSERFKRETGRSSEEKRDGFLDRDDIVGRNLKKRTEVAGVETLELQETLEKLREILSDSNFLDNSEQTRSKLSDDFVTFIPVSFVSDPEAVRKLGDPKYLDKSKTQDSNKEKHLPVEYINNELFLKLENRGPLASELIRKWLREQAGSECFKRETGRSSEEKRDGFSDRDDIVGRNLKKRTEVAGVETLELQETLEKLREILSDSNFLDNSEHTRSKLSDDFVTFIPVSFISDPEAVRKLGDPKYLNKSKTQDSNKEKHLPVEYINNELFLKLENRGPLASELIRKWLREQTGSERFKRETGGSSEEKRDGFSDGDNTMGRNLKKRTEVAGVETQESRETLEKLREILSDSNLPDSSQDTRKVSDDFTVIDIPGSFTSDPEAVRKLDDPENLDKSKTQDSSKEKLLPVEYINNELFLKLENRGPLASELIRKWLREQAGSERFKRETGRSSEEKRDGFLDRDDIVGRNLKKRTEVARVETLELQETLEKLREILSDSNFLDNSEHTRSKLSDDFVTFIPVSFVSDPEAVRKLDDPENVDKSKTQDSNKEKLLPVGYINNELFLKLENRGPLASELIRKWLREQAGSERFKRETGRSSEEKRDGFLDRDDIVGRNLKKRTEVAGVETLELQETLEKLREILSDSNFLDNSEHTRKVSDDFTVIDIPGSFISDPAAVRKLDDPENVDKSKTQDSSKEKHLPVGYINNELFLKLENRGPLASELIRKWLQEQAGSERFKRETDQGEAFKQQDGPANHGRRFMRHAGPHDAGGIQTLISTGTLAPVLPGHKESTNSIDLIFATYWFYPTDTQIILPEQQKCIDDWMAKESQRLDPKNVFYGLDHDAYEHMATDKCTETGSTKKQREKMISRLGPLGIYPFNIHTGELTVYRLRLTCHCKKLSKQERCAKILPYPQQQWAGYMGTYGNSHFSPRN